MSNFGLFWSEWALLLPHYLEHSYDAAGRCVDQDSFLGRFPPWFASKKGPELRSGPDRVECPLSIVSALTTKMQGDGWYYIVMTAIFSAPVRLRPPLPDSQLQKHRQ